MHKLLPSKFIFPLTSVRKETSITVHRTPPSANRLCFMKVWIKPSLSSENNVFVSHTPANAEEACSVKLWAACQNPVDIYQLHRHLKPCRHRKDLWMDVYRAQLDRRPDSRSHHRTAVNVAKTKIKFKNTGHSL